MSQYFFHFLSPFTPCRPIYSYRVFLDIGTTTIDIKYQPFELLLKKGSPIINHPFRFVSRPGGRPILKNDNFMGGEAVPVAQQ